MHKKQLGASSIAWLVLVLMLGFAVTMGLRLFPMYMHAYTVQRILEDVARESQGMDRNPEQIWSSINKRLDINDIDDIKRENFTYKTHRGVTTIGVQYEDRTKLIGNLDAVARFEYFETLAGERTE